jgi:hypothetical protein
MKQMIQDKLIAWLRGLVWAAMIAGCAWASAQNYLVQPVGGNYRAVAMGEGVGLGQGIGAEGAQNSAPLPKDDLFAGTEVFAKGATNVTEITMDPDSLNLVGGSDEHKARTMVLNVVRTYEYDKPGMYNMADVEAIRNKLNTGDWHCSVHVRDLKNGSGTDVCAKRRTDGMKETAIIEVEPKELTFIHTIRRGGGPGSSDLGFFPMLPGLGPTAMIAMTNPEALADMQIGFHGLAFLAQPDVHVYMRNFSGDMKEFNSPEFKEKMDELNKQMKDLKLHPPIDQEQMQKLRDQMKEFNKDFYRNNGAETPQPPAAPQAAPAPAPAPPQVPQ